MLHPLSGRNGSGEFARRSIRNLDYLLDAASHGAPVHPVTQTVTALLAITLFPWERSALDTVKNLRLEVAHAKGWPAFKMSGPCVADFKVKTVGHLVEQLRHSIAHGHVSFDSDSRLPTDVNVVFESIPSPRSPPDWRGEIRADQLAEFCRVFSGFIGDYVA